MVTLPSEHAVPVGQHALLEELRVKCPNLYREGGLRCGFSCPPGWEVLVRMLSVALEVQIEAMPEEQRATHFVDQVKEKFGALRFYMHGPTTPTMYALITDIENQSARICDVCGEPGGPTSGGWIRTRCQAHKDT